MKIRVENLHKRYRNKVVLKDISFSVDDNEIISIVGPNGAGKTTMLEIMMTLRSFNSGNIVISDEQINSKNLKKIRQKIGVVFQEGGMYAYLKIKEILKFFSEIYQIDKARIDEVIHLFNLSSHLSVKFESLSGGWKQRVLLAVAFLNKPEVLFLDEPTTGLDPEATEDLWKAINIAKKEGATIVLSTHSLEEIDMYADRVLILNKGEIIEYKEPTKIKEDYGVQFFKEAYFQILKGDNANE